MDKMLLKLYIQLQHVLPCSVNTQKKQSLKLSHVHGKEEVFGKSRWYTHFVLIKTFLFMVSYFQSTEPTRLSNRFALILKNMEEKSAATFLLSKNPDQCCCGCRKTLMAIPQTNE